MLLRIYTRLSKHPARPKECGSYASSPYPSTGYTTATLVTGHVYSPSGVFNFTFLIRPLVQDKFQ